MSWWRRPRPMFTRHRYTPENNPATSMVNLQAISFAANAEPDVGKPLLGRGWIYVRENRVYNG